MFTFKYNSTPSHVILLSNLLHNLSEKNTFAEQGDHLQNGLLLYYLAIHVNCGITVQSTNLKSKFTLITQTQTKSLDQSPMRFFALAAPIFYRNPMKHSAFSLQKCPQHKMFFSTVFNFWNASFSDQSKSRKGGAYNSSIVNSVREETDPSCFLTTMLLMI